MSIALHIRHNKLQISSFSMSVCLAHFLENTTFAAPSWVHFVYMQFS